MTTQEAVDYFAILQDKYGSPNLIESEIVDFLNHAVNEYINRVLPDSQGGVVNIEMDSSVLNNIAPIIFTISENTTSGLLTNAVIDAALVTESGDANAERLTILEVSVTDTGVKYPAKYTKYNNINAFERNFFKKSSSPDNVRYVYNGKGLQFYPTDDVVDIGLTVVKKPKTLALSPAVNPEFSDYVMYSVIAIALQLAGVSTRDTELIEDIRAISVQGK